MLEDEITWLDNFEPNRTAECETSEADNILLAGHLRLIKTLLSLCGAEKEMLGNYCFISSKNTSALSYCLKYHVGSEKQDQCSLLHMKWILQTVGGSLEFHV